MRKATLFICLGFMLALSACSNPFAPKTEAPPDDTGQQDTVELATTPGLVIQNLEAAFQARDKDLYETLLDIEFWFTETDCNGQLIFSNDREVELEIMGSRDGSSQGIFDIFRTVEFDFTLNKRNQEFGFEHPKVNEEDPDGHPDEDWEVFEGQVQILLLEENPNNGFRVDQTMIYKMRLLSQEELQNPDIVPELTDEERANLIENGESIWRMRRWDNDGVVGSNECGEIDEGDGVSKQIGGIKNIPFSALKNYLQ